jgi:hypothetical protein
VNDELQKQLAALLAKLSDYAGDATKFAADQIPPLVQEKIVYGRVSETLSLVIFVGSRSSAVLHAARKRSGLPSPVMT